MASLLSGSKWCAPARPGSPSPGWKQWWPSPGRAEGSPRAAVTCPAVCLGTTRGGPGTEQTPGGRGGPWRARDTQRPRCLCPPPTPHPPVVAAVGPGSAPLLVEPGHNPAELGWPSYRDGGRPSGPVFQETSLPSRPCRREPALPCVPCSRGGRWSWTSSGWWACSWQAQRVSRRASGRRDAVVSLPGLPPPHSPLLSLGSQLLITRARRPRRSSSKSGGRGDGERRLLSSPSHTRPWTGSCRAPPVN